MENALPSTLDTSLQVLSEILQASQLQMKETSTMTTAWATPPPTSMVGRVVKMETVTTTKRPTKTTTIAPPRRTRALGDLTNYVSGDTITAVKQMDTPPRMEMKYVARGNYGRKSGLITYPNTNNNADTVTSTTTITTPLAYSQTRPDIFQVVPATRRTTLLPSIGTVAATNSNTAAIDSGSTDVRGEEWAPSSVGRPTRACQREILDTTPQAAAAAPRGTEMMTTVQVMPALIKNLEKVEGLELEGKIDLTTTTHAAGFAPEEEEGERQEKEECRRVHCERETSNNAATTTSTLATTDKSVFVDPFPFPSPSSSSSVEPICDSNPATQPLSLPLLCDDGLVDASGVRTFQDHTHQRPGVAGVRRVTFRHHVSTLPSPSLPSTTTTAAAATTSACDSASASTAKRCELDQVLLRRLDRARKELEEGFAEGHRQLEVLRVELDNDLARIDRHQRNVQACNGHYNHEAAKSTIGYNTSVFPTFQEPPESWAARAFRGPNVNDATQADATQVQNSRCIELFDSILGITVTLPPAKHGALSTAL